MNDPVRLVYSEFDPGRPPFAWLRGRRLAADEDHSEVFRIMATISAEAKVVERPGVRAMRHRPGKAVLVEMDLSDNDPGGAPIRLTVVFVVGRTTTVSSLGDCAGGITAELTAAGIRTEQGRVSDALEWGYLHYAHRFPRLVAWFRRIVPENWRGRGSRRTRKVEAT